MTDNLKDIKIIAICYKSDQRYLICWPSTAEYVVGFMWLHYFIQVLWFTWSFDVSIDSNKKKKMLKKKQNTPMCDINGWMDGWSLANWLGLHWAHTNDPKWDALTYHVRNKYTIKDISTNRNYSTCTVSPITTGWPSNSIFKCLLMDKSIRIYCNSLATVAFDNSRRTQTEDVI